MTDLRVNVIRIIDLTAFRIRNTSHAATPPQIAQWMTCCVLRHAYATGRLLIATITLIVAAEASCAAASDQLWHVGVNFAGAEFNGKRIPGKINKDYQYPKKRDIDYFLDRGVNTFRLPFRWERLQLNLAWELEPKELAQLDKTVAYITDSGAHVLLDPHNYARYFGKIIGSEQVPVSAFASFWADLATHFKDNERVIFGLMNEPHGIRADDWRGAAEAAIVAIRATGAKNFILVPGTSWSGAHSWTKKRNGVSNASALRDLTDPAGNMAFEVHQYLDSDYSGTSSECQSETIGRKTLERFTQWLRENKHRGFLGEFGAANNPVCLAALDQMLQYVTENSDVWIGWTYWAAGAWWGDYRFSVHPSPEGDKPQLEVLMKYLAAP
jgi:endoglucanase